MPNELADYVNDVEFGQALRAAGEAMDKLRHVVVAQVAREIVETAREFAPDEHDFETAIQAEGPDSEHALWVVQDKWIEKLDDYPTIVDVMRNSMEWDDDFPGNDAVRAAQAIVNESLEQAQKLWDETLTAESKPDKR